MVNKDLSIILAETKYLDFLAFQNDATKLFEFCLKDINLTNDKIINHFISENTFNLNKTDYGSELNKEPSIFSGQDNKSLESLTERAGKLLRETKASARFISDSEPTKKEEISKIIKRIAELEDQLIDSKKEGFSFLIRVVWHGIKIAIGLLVLLGFAVKLLAGIAGAALAAGAIGTTILSFVGAFLLLIPLYFTYWITVLAMVKKSIEMKDNGTLSDKERGKILKELKQKAIEVNELAKEKIKTNG